MSDEEEVTAPEWVKPQQKKETIVAASVLPNGGEVGDIKPKRKRRTREEIERDRESTLKNSVTIRQSDFAPRPFKGGTPLVGWTPPPRRFSVRPFIQWRDIWIGLYIDTSHRRIYFCPFPMIGIKITY